MAEVYRLKYLRGRRLKVFLAAADRIIPADGVTPGGGTMLTAGIVDWSLSRIDAGLRGQILGLLLGVELLGFFFGLKPFTMLSAKKQDRLLAWMESSPVRLMRMGFFGIKSYVCMGYYPREDAWKVIGYTGPVLPDRPYPDPIIRALCRGEAEVVS
jgi:hypothetical protein